MIYKLSERFFSRFLSRIARFWWWPIPVLLKVSSNFSLSVTPNKYVIALDVELMRLDV